MKRFLFTLGWVSLTTHLWAADLELPGWTFEEQQLITSDSLTLTAWLGSPNHGTKAPLVVLLHMLGKTHESFTPLLEALQEHLAADSAEGASALPYVLMFDLRGHGSSTGYPGSSLDYKEMDEAQFMNIPDDVRAMVCQVLADSSLAADSDNIVVVGASIGANAAALLTATVPGITKVAMLSPGENYRGLVPANALKVFRGDLLVVAEKDDTYSDYSSRKLALMKPDQAVLQIFDGKDHGTNIINNDQEAMQQLVDWLFPRTGSVKED